MKLALFDLHPKASTSARKKTVLGGLLTTTTVLVAIVLFAIRASVDLGKRTEEVRINELAHDETIPLYFDISFLEVTSCNGKYQVEVLDALGKAVVDKDATTSMRHWGKECRVSGMIHVPTGKGTFRIFPTVAVLENIHANHLINSLMLGTSLPGVAAETRSLQTEAISTNRVGAYSYYLSLVPTTSNGVHGYQIAATRTFVELNSPFAARGSLYFYYEASPVRMHLDSRLTLGKFFHFLSHAIGIISGLFAFVGALREIFLKVNTSTEGTKKKKKSSLVM